MNDDTDLRALADDLERSRPGAIHVPPVTEPGEGAPSPFTPDDGLPPVPRKVGDPLAPVQPFEGPEPDLRALARARRRKRTRVSLAVAAFVLVAVVGGGWWTLFGRPFRVAPGHTAIVSVARGATVPAIAKRLETAGVVRNALAFEFDVKLNGAGEAFKAGTYRLSTGMPNADVISALEEGATGDVTIPEGFTVRQIARRLEEHAGISAAEFERLALTQGDTFKQPFLKGNPTKSLEGYLFPKTYLIRPGTSARDVINTMLDQFGSQISSVDLAYARSRNLTLHDVVTIASIIEKETPLARERPLVASVVYNRLQMNRKLGMESTVRYALGGKATGLSYNDVRIDNPYNTYRYKGLPPGAICNPGLAALDAAAHPADTKYLYFVTTHKDGSSTFTTNAADFEKAKAAGIH